LLEKITSENEMKIDLQLLLFSAGLKAFILIVLALFLIMRWNRQNKKYLTDFPFLMALTFFGYAVGKMYDMVLYFVFRDTPNLAEVSEFSSSILAFVKARFVISPVMVVAPFLLLMMIIWFGEKRKLQIILSSSWFVISVFSIIIVKNYAQILIVNALVAFPVILLSILSFFVIHHQQKLPEINSLYLAFGWSTYVLTQLIRPLWINLGSGNWGLTWIGEFVELGTLLVIGFGFMVPASYAQKEDEIINLGLNKKNKILQEENNVV
jgi:hypothetical protein